jgi:hypothetical protein
MEKRVYNLTRQETPYFCIPAAIQAIMRRRGREESQSDIAKEIGCVDERAVIFGENLAAFFERRDLDFRYHHYNELPVDDPYYLMVYCFENGVDLMAGYKSKQDQRGLHIKLATSFTDPNVTLLDPDTCAEYTRDINELIGRMRKDKSGGFGLVEKI